MHPVMPCTEDKEALREIKGLSSEARMYLQDRLRNGLQRILSSLEAKGPREARDAVFDLADELRRMRL